jgi:dolichyl-phosphate beta-glucosyltransferase
VVPAYNEEHRLPTSLQRLRAYLEDQGYSYEVLVVDNGSSDRTREATEAAAVDWPQLRCLSMSERGKGLAVKVGALSARGDRLMFCDADLAMPVEEIARFLPPLEAADVVIATREGPGARRIGEPDYRHLMGRVFNLLVRWLAVPGFQDTQCGFKAFSRASAELLFPRVTIRGFGFDVEVLYLARKYGLRTVEVPIVWYFQADSRVDPLRDTLRMVRDLLRIRWNDLRGVYG